MLVKIVFFCVVLHKEDTFKQRSAVFSAIYCLRKILKVVELTNTFKFMLRCEFEGLLDIFDRPISVANNFDLFGDQCVE